MLLRSIISFLALPCLVAGVIPLVISWINSPYLLRSNFGFLPMGIGFGILVVSVISFHRRGRGTLAPWDPPRHLVVQDLYCLTRNPMYLGVLLLLIGWALITGNPWNYGYTILLAIIFHLRVVHYEEHQMKRRFGEEWENYRQAVPRWGLRLRPYSPTEPEDDARLEGDTWKG